MLLHESLILRYSTTSSPLSLTRDPAPATGAESNTSKQWTCLDSFQCFDKEAVSILFTMRHTADGGKCNLQGEIPPQSEMRIGGVMGFVPYAATASLLASAMGAPPGMQVLCLLLCNSCAHLKTPSSIEKGAHGIAMMASIRQLAAVLMIVSSFRSVKRLVLLAGGKWSA